MNNNQTKLINSALKVAKASVKKVGKMLLAKRSDLKVEVYKDLVDFSTNLDVVAEKYIIDSLTTNFPDHNIISEEMGQLNKHSLYTWVIDPIDGTKEFQRGLSNFSVCLTLQTPTEILLSCVYIPVTKELFFSGLNQGSWQGKKQLVVSTEKNLNKSMVVFHAPDYKNTPAIKAKHWLTVTKMDAVDYRTFVRLNDNMLLCDLARGGYDGYIHLATKTTGWWDVAPGILIAQEAGATVTDSLGQALNPNQLDNGIVISNGLIHSQLLEIVNQ
jgi:myo-inositol-1(or 4)-monophosphatase